MAGLVREESPLEVTTKGAIAGFAGTLVLTVALAQLHQLTTGGPSAPGERNAEARSDAKDPTERLVEKVAAGVFETELSAEARQTLGMGIHWGYGTFWGIVYAIFQSSLRLPGWLHGTLLGVFVWVIGPMGLIPAMKLAPSVGRTRRQRAIAIAMHLLYGWTTAATFRLLSRDA